MRRRRERKTRPPRAKCATTGCGSFAAKDADFCAKHIRQREREDVRSYGPWDEVGPPEDPRRQ